MSLVCELYACVHTWDRDFIEASRLCSGIVSVNMITWTMFFFLLPFDHFLAFSLRLTLHMVAIATDWIWSSEHLAANNVCIFQHCLFSVSANLSGKNQNKID